jgi:voltage-gated potassium channel
MYFIASGEVEVKVEPQPVRLGAGSFFGELALLGSGVRTATVTTTAPTTLLALDLTDFRTFAAHHPELARAVEGEALRRQAESSQGGASSSDAEEHAVEHSVRPSQPG